MRFLQNARRLLSYQKVYGVDFTRLGRSIIGIGPYVSDYRRYQRSHRGSETGSLAPSFQFRTRPMLADRFEAAGSLGVYAVQDLWAARRIFERAPADHVDVGSRVDGFVTHILVFAKVTVVDIRPRPPVGVSGMSFVQSDATSLAGLEDRSVPSLSSLHAIEHFGLGRYGDPVDPDGWLRGLRSLQRVLAPGGHLYLSVPVGAQRVEFNSQRVFQPATIAAAAPELRLLEFSYIDGNGALHEFFPISEFKAQEGCGLFRFERPAA